MPSFQLTFVFIFNWTKFLGPARGNYVDYLHFFYSNDRDRTTTVKCLQTNPYKYYSAGHRQGRSTGIFLSSHPKVVGHTLHIKSLQVCQSSFANSKVIGCSFANSKIVRKSFPHTEIVWFSLTHIVIKSTREGVQKNMV